MYIQVPSTMDIELSGCYHDPATRLESGSDDPDNLGHLSHFFGG